jgi:hypothetical protein
MNTESANRAANAARNPNTMVYGAVFFGATLLGYYYYKRTSDASNLGDAVSGCRAGCRAGVTRAPPRPADLPLCPAAGLPDGRRRGAGRGAGGGVGQRRRARAPGQEAVEGPLPVRAGLPARWCMMLQLLL